MWEPFAEYQSWFQFIKLARTAVIWRFYNVAMVWSVDWVNGSVSSCVMTMETTSSVFGQRETVLSGSCKNQQLTNRNRKREIKTTRTKFWHTLELFTTNYSVISECDDQNSIAMPACAELFDQTPKSSKLTIILAKSFQWMTILRIWHRCWLSMSLDVVCGTRRMMKAEDHNTVMLNGWKIFCNYFLNVLGYKICETERKINRQILKNLRYWDSDWGHKPVTGL